MISQQEMRPAAVITGASDGIGRAIARYIARERGVVVLVGRSPERLAATADELTQAGAEPKMLELDLVADNAIVRLGEFLERSGCIATCLLIALASACGARQFPCRSAFNST